jgi:hypothetical protein
MQTAQIDDEHRAAHAELHAALYLQPWQWPVVEHPNSACPYPSGAAAAQHWPVAIQLYEELAEAAAKHRKRGGADMDGSVERCVADMGNC